MRTFLTRFTFLAMAGLVLASALSPASAATRHRRAVTPAPVQSEYSDQALQSAPVASRVQGEPSIVYDQPYACFTDEGYGRYASCDQAGF